MYFPLYNGVNSVLLGITKDADLRLLPPRPGKPLLFYGTSITQGGCASRPGMPHPHILGRRLDRIVYNFGFSGSGKMEPVLAHAFAELDPAVYVLDCVPNMNQELIRERVKPFVKILREKRPQTPILLVEDATPADTWANMARKDTLWATRGVLKEQYQALVDEGIPNLFYLSGENLCPEDNDGYVDNGHPNDYGFVKYADGMEPILRQIVR